MGTMVQKQKQKMTHKDIFESLKYQEGGNHYSKMKVQPAYFINENNLPFAEGNAIKYICRHKHKGKEQDIKKAIHYLNMILDRDYS
jgi:hypothetical protein